MEKSTVDGRLKKKKGKEEEEKKYLAAVLACVLPARPRRPRDVATLAARETDTARYKRYVRGPLAIEQYHRLGLILPCYRPKSVGNSRFRPSSPITGQYQPRKKREKRGRRRGRRDRRRMRTWRSDAALPR
ncbi:hypothetical protein GW17_00029745 [Ensete ventricosum]|nr:hypothetical protein GW17_00029745 [Ensete ventricosum]